MINFRFPIPKIPLPEIPTHWSPIAQMARTSQMLIKILLMLFIIAMVICAVMWWIWAIFDRLMERRDIYYQYKKNGGKD